jgi:hypothetical protein
MEPASTDCHVYVGNDYIDKLTPLDSAQQKEQQRLVEDFVSAACGRVPCVLQECCVDKDTYICGRVVACTRACICISGVCRRVGRGR